MLVLEHISKRYGEMNVLDDFSLTLEEGTFFGFMGENGAGKTTLLKIAACLLQPDSGSVEIDGIDALKHPYDARNHIGYVPDNFGLYDNLTVREYMEFYAATYGLSGYKARSIYMDILKSLNLDDRLDHFVDTLSRGMKQRLCMARAMIHNPNILILDEPFTGIDSELHGDMNELCRDMVRNGKIVMFSSHQFNDMEPICNRIGVLKNGRLRVYGTIDEVNEQIRISQAIAITVLHDRDSLINLLREEPSVKALSINGDTVQIRGQFNGEQEAQLLQKIIGAGIPITDFSHRSSDLEQIFHAVMTEPKGGHK